MPEFNTLVISVELVIGLVLLVFIAIHWSFCHLPITEHIIGNQGMLRILSPARYSHQPKSVSRPCPGVLLITPAHDIFSLDLQGLRVIDYRRVVI